MLKLVRQNWNNVSTKSWKSLQNTPGKLVLAQSETRLIDFSFAICPVLISFYTSGEYLDRIKGMYRFCLREMHPWCKDGKKVREKEKKQRWSVCERWNVKTNCCLCQLADATRYGNGCYRSRHSSAHVFELHIVSVQCISYNIEFNPCASCRYIFVSLDGYWYVNYIFWAWFVTRWICYRLKIRNQIVAV